MKRARLMTIGLLVVLAATAQPLAQAPQTIRFTEAKLANGLRVIVSEDPVAPV